ncbi:hypothetical protein ABZ368_16150 [Streptomyces sp. NPDC005908]|uniref:MmyB family transcriptional regulator n=1 Tax=unclassified Streptomyces TaxID=2593676 RepID=UPI0011AD882E|nr:hypothetical protein [Streptomyces sp. T12]TWD17444.1 hypothetical protein FB570_11157 [Streptomyces sp. T12]
MTEAHPDATDAAVDGLRRAAGRFPRDKRLAALIRDLNAGSRRFAELWEMVPA